MASKLTEGLQLLFPTTDPKVASKTDTGATVTKGRRAERQDGEANYLPLIALGAAAALVIWAMLRPGPLLGNGLHDALPREQPESYQEPRYEERWEVSAQEE